MAPPRPRGRAFPRGEGAVPHGVPGSPRLAGGGRIAGRASWRRTPARGRGGSPRPPLRASLDAEHRQRAGRADVGAPGKDLTDGRADRVDLFLRVVPEPGRAEAGWLRS